ncbi:hypothetical protein QBC32DRAFT_218365 [Pseudoneurospora amorphoporcata]|uniref:Mid2 domain-containing protein n=1 Tax=Pseudoneurospora amorphoporcata TaxID=241081 RepID=A0AAN6SDW5_9PEZI|nr:hypothetical protein QBC32DRAFT_218365 [Pseudoneurospora amorphoporcata]
MFTLFLFTLLLSSIAHTFALNVTAHLGARARDATTTLIQQKRQNGVIVTRLSTVFLSGDSSKTRTANPGYDCRIDLSAKLWGFCPTTVIAASDCGLAGSCVDNHACSKGCGFTNQDLTTFTCKDPGNDYCSTAFLTLSNRDLGAFAYIACGRAPNLDNYLAYTTNAITPIPIGAQPTTSATEAPASTSKIASETGTSTSSSSPTTSAAPSASRAEGTKDDSNGNNNNNIGAIVGGVVGSLAVLCGSIVAIVWIIRRNRKEKALASSSSSQAERDMVDQTGSGGSDNGATSGSMLNETKYPDIYGSERGMGAPTYTVQELEHNEYRGWKPPQELAAVRSPREMADTWVKSMPVELPAGSIYWKSGGGGRGGNDNMI